jgi:hypothetical protein
MRIERPLVLHARLSLSLSCVEEAITYLRGRCFVGLQEELQKGWSVGRQVEPLLSVAPLDI